MLLKLAQSYCFHMSSQEPPNPEEENPVDPEAACRELKPCHFWGSLDSLMFLKLAQSYCFQMSSQEPPNLEEENPVDPEAVC